MTHLIDGARQILAEHDETAVAHGFTERLEVAARGGSDGPAPRTIAAPYYLTDLGVRRFDDPALFYRAHAERFGWTETISVAGTDELMLDIPVEDLARLLDAVVLVLGDYETAVDVVRRRYGSIEASTDFDLQLTWGFSFAAHGDESCRPLFAAASEQPHVGAVHRFMAHHRLARRDQEVPAARPRNRDRRRDRRLDVRRRRLRRDQRGRPCGDGFRDGQPPGTRAARDRRGNRSAG